jgi:hypothetical protein
MRMMRGGRGLGAALVLLGAACTAGITDPEGIEVQLRGGDGVRVKGTVLRLSFGRVLEDSRCPRKVTCVWAGNALVEVGIAAGMGPTQPLYLNSSLEPREENWNGVRVRLVKVEPQPTAGEPISFESYRITLRPSEAR